MLRSMGLCLGVGFVFATTLASTACTVKSTAAPDADAGPGAPTEAGSPVDSSTGDSASPAALGFTPSNVDLSGVDLSKVGDFVVDQPSCTIESGENLASCGNGGDVLAFKIMTQSDGSKVGVYIARSMTIPLGHTLTVQGANAVAFIALDKIDVFGRLDANAAGDVPGPGASPKVLTTNTKGTGPGGGAAGSTVAGSGASYCGTGGKGAAETGSPTIGGATYGTATLTPLVGGSAGGAGDPGAPGSGGGAVQLVAAHAITIGPGAVVHAGGGGGGFGGSAGNMQEASGGGSGGAILLEAATVTVAGTLAANGGGGGGGTSSSPLPFGADGSPSGAPAKGGVANGISPGGNGSAAGDVNGGDGSVTAGDTAGAGGGGAGRIRINTKSGAATLSGGTLSPAASTPCATQGSVH